MKRRMISFLEAIVLLLAGIGPASGEGGWMETEKSMDIWQSIAGALSDAGDIVSGAVEQAGDDISSAGEAASAALAEAADNLPVIWKDLSGLLESAGEDAALAIGEAFNGAAEQGEAILSRFLEGTREIGREAGESLADAFARIGSAGGETLEGLQAFFKEKLASMGYGEGDAQAVLDALIKYAESKGIPAEDILSTALVYLSRFETMCEGLLGSIGEIAGSIRVEELTGYLGEILGQLGADGIESVQEILEQLKNMLSPEG